MNVVNLTGRVAKEPEVRGTVTTLIVATEWVKLKDGKTYKEEAAGYTAKTTEYHKVTCFNGLGTAAVTSAPTMRIARISTRPATPLRAVDVTGTIGRLWPSAGIWRPIFRIVSLLCHKMRVHFYLLV